MSEAQSRRDRTWQLLQRKAEIKLEEGVASMARARRQRDDLQSALERLSRLEEDYADRLRLVETAPHRLAVNIGHRLYLDQLHQLRARIVDTMRQAESDYRAARNAYLELARGCERAKRSRELIVERKNAEQLKAERKSLDAVGISGYSTRRRQGAA